MVIRRIGTAAPKLPRFTFQCPAPGPGLFRFRDSKRHGETRALTLNRYSLTHIHTHTISPLSQPVLEPDSLTSPNFEFKILLFKRAWTDMECLGIPIDHRLRRLIQKARPINTNGDSEHIRILQKFGKALKMCIARATIFLHVILASDSNWHSRNQRPVWWLSCYDHIRHRIIQTVS
ncbi:uncharacterized protein ASPGLDRAFT_1192861 [Aspergillus glaucus CBS 516.65]|uniref:Uncharacterized protein n=1 Tax=Aspergillus glaucus CBS 516.65 TaxID=1160497 RepID=A0A1L9V4D1_ASPGL|nr:hypothetical protein ASPGLDRAFT_1192861 [Aspergillus glaucus CBS 516.65]OJJ78770.1 hypothetical protein ASPGLDRAFT_1192861 [Aspergillus glaucus CBS 516.65]